MNKEVYKRLLSQKKFYDGLVLAPLACPVLIAILSIVAFLLRVGSFHYNDIFTSLVSLYLVLLCATIVAYILTLLFAPITLIVLKKFNKMSIGYFAIAGILLGALPIFAHIFYVIIHDYLVQGKSFQMQLAEHMNFVTKQALPIHIQHSSFLEVAKRDFLNMNEAFLWLVLCGLSGLAVSVTFWYLSVWTKKESTDK